MFQRVFSHDSVFNSSKDDGVQNDADTAQRVLEDPRYIALMPHKNAAFIFMAVNYIMYEMHVAIIEGDTRKKGLQHAVESSRWMFQNTPCQKIITYIPEYHLRALMFAKVCGMKKEGTLKDSFLVDGKLHDLVVLGATKDKFITLHGEV